MKKDTIKIGDKVRVDECVSHFHSGLIGMVEDINEEGDFIIDCGDGWSGTCLASKVRLIKAKKRKYIEKCKKCGVATRWIGADGRTIMGMTHICKPTKKQSLKSSLKSKYLEAKREYEEFEKVLCKKLRDLIEAEQKYRSCK